MKLNRVYIIMSFTSFALQTFLVTVAQICLATYMFRTAHIFKCSVYVDTAEASLQLQLTQVFMHAGAMHSWICIEETAGEQLYVTSGNGPCDHRKKDAFFRFQHEATAAAAAVSVVHRIHNLTSYRMQMLNDTENTAKNMHICICTLIEAHSRSVFYIHSIHTAYDAACIYGAKKTFCKFEE
jgi:hypothetical protein